VTTTYVVKHFASCRILADFLVNEVQYDTPVWQTALSECVREGHLQVGPHCLHGQAPGYLVEHITPATEVTSRHRLRSANRHLLTVPRCWFNTYGRRAFSVAGPTVWNSLPDELRDSANDIGSFKQFFSKQSFLVSTTVIKWGCCFIFFSTRRLRLRDPWP